MLGIEFGWREIIDILLVATLMYEIYRLLRKSGAMTIFWGIVLFLVVWFLTAYVFALELTGAIFDKVMNVGAIALLVIFQEEIRDFFNRIGAQFGRFNFRVGKRVSEEEKLRQNDEISLACNHMSATKTGALIILSGKDPLDAYIETGEQVDAAISARLIENIFFKNTPLHDGALFISNGRIVSAAAILPVSKRTDIPKHYGLRHRAALGLVEHCDATAIVVSEETGKISVAKDGEIATISRDHVADFLNNL